MTPPKGISSFDEVEMCPQNLLYPQYCQLMMDPESKRGISCGNPGSDAGSADPQRWALTLDQFVNRALPFLDSEGYREICAGGEGSARGSRAIFATKNPMAVVPPPATPGAPSQDLIDLIANSSVHTTCQAPRDIEKRTLPADIDLSSARYLASKLRHAADSCFSAEKNGLISYKLNPEVVANVISGMEADKKNNALPAGMTAEKADELIGLLGEIKPMTPAWAILIQYGSQFVIAALAALIGGGVMWLVMKAATEKQIKAMSEQMARQLEAQREQTDKLLAAQREQTEALQRGPELKLGDIATDSVAEWKEKLAADPDSEILGRDDEALEYLHRLAAERNPANVFLEGESGAGKDFVYDRAAQLVALEDSRVPDIFRSGRARLYKVNPVSYSATPGTVGSSASRFQLIEQVMREGHRVYFPEFADAASSGAHSAGNAEALGALFKVVGSEAWSRLSGSGTTEGLMAMRADLRFRDLFRRIERMLIAPMDPELILKIVRGKVAPSHALDHNVTLGEGVAEEAARIGRARYESWKLAEVNACKMVLKDAIMLAKGEAGWTNENVFVSRDHVTRAAETRAAERNLSLQNWCDGRAGPSREFGPDGALAMSLVGDAVSELSSRLPGYRDLLPAKQAEIAAVVYEALRDGNFRRAYVAPDGRIMAEGLEWLITRVRRPASVAAPAEPVRPERPADAADAGKDDKAKDVKRDNRRGGNPPVR
ncbi:MAG: hypothetical protein V2A66_01240 [Pseudomonadota bacterium]